jgi:hypothetical protein
LRKLERNGKLKEKNSTRMRLKIQLIEQQLRMLRLLNSRESMKTNLSGFVTKTKSKRKNTKISTRTFSRIQAAHSLGLISLLKEKLTLLDLFLFLSVHPMTNSKNFIKRNPKSSSM